MDILKFAATFRFVSFHRSLIKPSRCVTAWSWG